MTIKFLEIRDRGTCIAAMAFDLSKADGPIAQHAGFGEQPCYVLVNLSKMACQYDPWNWDLRFGRTMHVAHVWLVDHWAEVQSGDVIDAEYILGERSTTKTAEIGVRS